jgi:hypothetical protein
MWILTYPKGQKAKSKGYTCMEESKLSCKSKDEIEVVNK